MSNDGKKVWQEIQDLIGKIPMDDLEFLPDDTKQIMLSLINLIKKIMNESKGKDLQEILDNSKSIMQIIQTIFAIFNTFCG